MTSLDNWSRPYLQDSSQKPHLYFLVFGSFDQDGPLQEKESFQEAITVLPQGVEVHWADASQFRSGFLWEMCQRETPKLAAQVENCRQALVLRGTVEYHESLDYLKGTLDFLTFLVEEGGRVVHDPYTLSWHDEESWLEMADQGQIFSPFDHVVIFSSPEPEGVWLHTRGMLKFGRPELSARSLSEAEVEVLKKVMDRFIGFQALGGVIEPGREIVLEGEAIGYRPSGVQGSLEDPDFNNYHVELKGSDS